MRPIAQFSPKTEDFDVVQAGNNLCVNGHAAGNVAADRATLYLSCWQTVFVDELRILCTEKHR